KLLPHVISAVVVTTVLLWTVIRVLSNYSSVEALRRPAVTLLALLVTQLALGFAAYLTRVQWGRNAVQPELLMVVATVAHVALGGIGLVAAGTAALNEVIEHDVDARMRRTAFRPLPAKRMSLIHATIAGAAMTLGGVLYLGLAANALTGVLALATSLMYLCAY